MANWETILETDNFIVDYDKTNAKYRVSYFEDNHFVDDCEFTAPVVHGEWEFVGQDDNDMPIYKCPMCGRKQFGRSTYCGDCGNRLIWDGGRK